VLDYISPDLRALAVPVSELRPAPDNARRHSLDRDVPALMASMGEHGQQKAIVAKRTYRGVENVVIAGNGTLLAARRLGWSHLAVSWFTGSDDEARRYALRDNRVAELSAWSADALRTLQGDGVDLAALWGDPADLADLLGSDAPVPDFSAVAESAQGQLDALKGALVTCPHCGKSLDPRG
jgi:ParB family chromosome partitioning protein